MTASTPLRTIRFKQDSNLRVLEVIDQRLLPHQLSFIELNTYRDVVLAIEDMVVRGAPLIGVCAAYGMYLACLEAPSNQVVFNQFVENASRELLQSRPTAVNLKWAIDKQMEVIALASTPEAATKNSLETANEILDNDIENCFQIGQHTLPIIQALSQQKNGEVVNILTHCNAGWLGCVDWGTATSGIYQAHKMGIKIHVWVDETRPRNQGFNLTAWELQQRGVPHTLIVDNTGGYLMQNNQVDMCIVGTDRTTRNGDVCNKIGTYLKALAAKDNNVPFYVCVPSSSIDWQLKTGKDIPIEERNSREVTHINGWYNEQPIEVSLAPLGCQALNIGFDVTPSKLITSLITENGVCEPSEEGLLSLFKTEKHQIV